MALVKCKDCGGLVSSKAKACPSCGAEAPRKSSFLSRFFAGLVALFVILNGLAWIFNDDRPKTEEEQAAEERKKSAEDLHVKGFMAIQGAKSAVLAKLKDPESAEFGDVGYREPGIVCGFVNAKNSFGGYTGQRAFIADSGEGYLYLQDDTPGFKEIWNTRCPVK